MLSVILPVITGLVGHRWFHKSQPQVVSGIFGLLFGPPTILAILLHEHGDKMPTIMRNILQCYALYLVSLISSVVLYRLSPFHPLAKYPGPVLGKISRLWAFRIANSGDQHRYYHELHEQYGPIIRTGPNHLLVRDANAIPILLGPGKDRWRKGARYETTKVSDMPGSLISIVDPQEHVQRRRMWEPAFTAASLKSYEEMLACRALQLVSAVEARFGQTLDLSEWFGYFAFDFMGDLAYGGRFNMMVEGGDNEGLIPLIERAAKGAEVLGTIPWFRPFFRMLPAGKDIIKFMELSKKTMLQRKASGSLTKDLFHHFFVEENDKGREPLALPTLVAEASLVIIAGSDTTSNTLSNALFYLLTHRSIYVRLQKEIDAAFPADVEIMDAAILASLPLLQAIINETLRLQPATPNGSQRIPPLRDGMPFMIADHVIPPGTTVQVPTYSIHRDPRYFWPNPEGFEPDRWLLNVAQKSPREFRHNIQAYIPFSYGPTNCVGKNLALMEVRMIIAMFFRKFEIRLAPGWDVNEWERNCKDHFVLTTGRLPVIVTPRT